MQVRTLATDFVTGRPLLLRRAVAIFLIVTPSAVCVVLGLSLPTNHDEFQYLAAGHLQPELQPYRDFFYSQPPYFPLALSHWLDLIEPLVGSPYVAGRLFNVGWSIVFVMSLVYVVMKTSSSLVPATVVVATVFASTWMDRPLRLMRNDMMPMALATLGFAAIVAAMTRSRRVEIWLLNFAGGVLIASAVGAKQSYAFVALAFAIHAVLAPHLDWKSRFQLLLAPLALGGAAGAIPMVVSVHPDWDVFAYSISEFHQTAHSLFGFGVAASEIGVNYRIQEMLRILAGPSTFVFLLLVLVLMFMNRSSLSPKAFSARTPAMSVVVLCTLAVVLVTVSCYFAVPLHGQYAAPALPFMAAGVCAFGTLLGERHGGRDPAGRRHWNAAPIPAQQSVIVMAAAGAVMIFGSYMLDRGALAHLKSMVRHNEDARIVYYNRVAGPRVWLIEHLRPVTRRLHDILGPPDPTLSIATMMSVYPIEAGFGIYREFAGAPFFYRSNDRLTDAQLERLHGTSPRRLEGFLARQDAKVLLTGYLEKLEDGFVRFAADRGFVCYVVDLDGAYGTSQGKLFVAPSLARRPGDC